jgi:hypothetical protein
MRRVVAAGAGDARRRARLRPPQLHRAGRVDDGSIADPRVRPDPVRDVVDGGLGRVERGVAAFDEPLQLARDEVATRAQGRGKVQIDDISVHQCADPMVRSENDDLHRTIRAPVGRTDSIG